MGRVIRSVNGSGCIEVVIFSAGCVPLSGDTPSWTGGSESGELHTTPGSKLLGGATSVSMYKKNDKVYIFTWLLFGIYIHAGVHFFQNVAVASIAPRNIHANISSRKTGTCDGLCCTEQINIGF